MKKLLDKALVFEEGQEPSLSDYCWLVGPYLVMVAILSFVLISVG
ncbi:hypothetical protein [Lysinibacillus sp. 54212]